MAQWKHVLNLADLIAEGEAGTKTYLEIGPLIAERIKAARWYNHDQAAEHAENLWWAIDELSDLNTPGLGASNNHDAMTTIDACLEAIYDWGDVDHRLWIETQRVEVAAR